MSNQCKNFKVTGTVPCYTKMGVEDRILIVPEFGSDGTKNTFANIAAVTKAALVAKIEETEQLDAFYVLPNVDNVGNERAEREMYEYESGAKSKLHEGIRSFASVFESLDTALLGRLEALEGQNIGYYAIDRDGNFRYTLGTDGVTVEPTMIDANTFFADLKLAMYKEPGQILIHFDWRDDMNDKDLRAEPFANLDFDGRGADLYGLLPVFITEEVPPSTTQFTISLLTDYNVVISGQTTTDFTVTNVTQSTTVTATSTESATLGTYVIAYAAPPSSADVLKVTHKHVKYENKELTLTAIP